VHLDLHTDNLYAEVARSGIRRPVRAARSPRQGDAGPGRAAILRSAEAAWQPARDQRSTAGHDTQTAKREPELAASGAARPWIAQRGRAADNRCKRSRYADSAWIQADIGWADPVPAMYRGP
jgi:hypothetical protein